MPLKPKNGLLPARTASSNPKPGAKKIVTPISGKANFSVKKPGRKAVRTKAGYQLYSAAKEDQTQRKDANSQSGAEGTFKTLVEEWMAKQALDSSLPETMAQREMTHIIKHHPGDTATTFNKRLVSSTPDPELLMDDGEEEDQLIPEHDTDQGPGGEAMSAQLTDCRMAAFLTDTQRQQFRQKLDAALIEEALSKNKNLQEQWKDMQKNQQAKASSLYPASALSKGASSQKKRSIPNSSTSHTTKATNAPRAVTKSATNSVLQKKAPVLNTTSALSGGQVVSAIPSADTATKSAPQTSETAASMWHDMGNRPQARDSDIGVFHHFLNRDSADLPVSLNQQKGATVGGAGLVFVPDGTDAVPNMSMGFSPFKGNLPSNPTSSRETSEPDYSTKPTTPHANNVFFQQPLSIVTDEGAMARSDCETQPVHQATPASSPVKDNERLFQPGQRNVQFGNSRTGHLFCQTASTAKQVEPAAYLRTPATSPEVDRLNFNFSGAQEQQSLFVSQKSKASISAVRSQPAARGQPDKDVSRSAESNYTCDGYYINGPVHVRETVKEKLPPQPRPFTPTPMQSPRLVGIQNGIQPFPVTSEFAQANLFKNSDACIAQANINQNMHNDTMQAPSKLQQAYPPVSMQAFIEQATPREAMADMEFAGLPFGAEAHMISNEDVLDPPAPVPSPVPQTFADREVLNGPRRLRSLLNELKETCAIDGDMEVCHIVQQICNLVELLPQLRSTFNLETEIGLALQPLRSECSQLRRRLRILNQQLRERERQEKEGLDPKIQMEILTLQTENMELQKKLTESEQSCQKLNLFISSQQQQMQTVQCQLQQKEHDKLVARQENVQQLNRLNQEVEKMSLRNQSLQSKLAAADCQNSVLDLNLKQSNIEISQLHDTLGRMKQAVLEVMQHIENTGQGDISHASSKVCSLPSFRILSSWVKSSPTSTHPPSYNTTATSSQGPLDISGNQRISRYPGAGRNENTQTSNLGDISQKPISRNASHSKSTQNAKELPLSKRSFEKSVPPTKDSAHSIRFRSTEAASVSNNSLSTGPISASPLTVAAVAAHNQLHDSILKEDHLSTHSWDGGECQNLSKNQPVPYHSDPESASAPSSLSKISSRKNRIHQWSASVEEERLHVVQNVRNSIHHEEFGKSASKTSWGKASGLSEVGGTTVPSLSEYPISEIGSGDSAAHAAKDNTRHSVTEYFKKYPENRQIITPKSPPKTPPKRSSQGEDDGAVTVTPQPKGTAMDKQSPTVSSPNASLTQSASNTTQKDYFLGTTLDTSLSTIQEDGLSSMTGMTGASISTAMSLDDRKFKEGVNALDEKINKCKESLQIWKKTFS